MTMVKMIMYCVLLTFLIKIQGMDIGVHCPRKGTDSQIMKIVLK